MLDGIHLIFWPQHWVIESLQTGLLKKQCFMSELRFVDVDYCKYGMPCRKRTRLWSNLVQLEPWDVRGIVVVYSIKLMGGIGKQRREQHAG